MDAPCRVRPATLADSARLLELERNCFPDPWSASAIRDVLEMPGAVTLVAEVDGRVVSYCLSRRLSTSAEVLTLGTDQAYRRQGIAAQVLRGLLARLGACGVAEVWLEVRKSNQDARRLYQGFGFQVAGMRRAYYRSPTEDALVLRLVLSGDA